MYKKIICLVATTVTAFLAATFFSGGKFLEATACAFVLLTTTSLTVVAAILEEEEVSIIQLLLAAFSVAVAGVFAAIVGFEMAESQSPAARSLFGAIAGGVTFLFLPVFFQDGDEQLVTIEEKRETLAILLEKYQQNGNITATEAWQQFAAAAKTVKDTTLAVGGVDLLSPDVLEKALADLEEKWEAVEDTVLLE
jgi:hypothetical protein